MDNLEKLQVVTHVLRSNNIKSFFSIDFIGKEAIVLLRSINDLKRLGTEVHIEVLSDEYTYKKRYLVVYRGIKFFSYSEEELNV